MRQGGEGVTTIDLKVGGTYEENYRTLVAFYQIYNPEKVGEVDTILKAYEGMEGRLFERLTEMQKSQQAADDEVGKGKESGEGRGEGFAFFDEDDEEEEEEEEGEEDEEVAECGGDTPNLDQAMAFFNSPPPASAPSPVAAQAPQPDPIPFEGHSTGLFGATGDAWGTDDAFAASEVASHLDDIFSTGGGGGEVITPNTDQAKGSVADQMRQLSSAPIIASKKSDNPFSDFGLDTNIPVKGER